MSAPFICSKGGFMIYSPFTRATLTSLIGKSMGIFEQASAVEAANPAKESGCSTPSADRSIT